MLSLLDPTTGSALFVIAGVISVVVLISIAMILLVATKRTAKKRNFVINSGNDIMTREDYDVILYS